MTTKMDVFITIPGEVNSAALYKEVGGLRFNVTDLGTKTYVHGRIDTREPIIEFVLQSCYKYSPTGTIEVSAKSVVEDQKTPQ